jgi:hypothetical protein
MGEHSRLGAQPKRHERERDGITASRPSSVLDFSTGANRSIRHPRGGPPSHAEHLQAQRFQKTLRVRREVERGKTADQHRDDVDATSLAMLVHPERRQSGPELEWAYQERDCSTGKVRQQREPARPEVGAELFRRNLANERKRTQQKEAE